MTSSPYQPTAPKDGGGARGLRNGADRPRPKFTKAAIESLTKYDLPSDAPIWERRMKALSLRNDGKTYPQIADELYPELPAAAGERRAELDCRTAIREVIRIPTDARIDRQHAIIMEMIGTLKPDAVLGDREAGAQLLSWLQHAAKLDGLYAPARVQVGVSETEFAGQAHALLAAGGPAVLRALAELARVPVAALSGEQQAPPLDVEEVAAPPPDPAAGWSNL